jgi:hypothetical protein
LADEVSSHHHWNNFGESFLDVLPYLENAYANIIVTLKDALASDADPRLGAIIEFLCQPDPRRRGHPAASKGRGSPFSLERVVSEIDLLTHKAYMRAGVPA